MLTLFAPDLYVADGPVVNFFGFPYPTRMAVIRLRNGDLWVWSPIELTAGLVAAVNQIGSVEYIVSPNKLHHLFLSEWNQCWPRSRLYAPPGLARKLPQLEFAAELGDQPEPQWASDLDQALFAGSPAMQEVVFLHRVSGTALFGDLIQRFPSSTANGWRGMLMRLSGLVDPRGGTPLDWRLSFLKHAGARDARRKVLRWQPQRLLIAHGNCAATGATQIIQAALRWI